MDRTAWIIIIFCAGLLGLNMYYRPEAPPTEAQKPQTTLTQPAQPNADAHAQATGQTTTPAQTPEQTALTDALAADKTAPLTLTVTEEGKPFITYTFNRVGGSIASVKLHDDIIDSQKVTDKCISINEANYQGIGQLAYNLNVAQDPTYDRAVYQEVKRTADSVTLQAHDAARNLDITKTYTLAPIKTEDGETLDGSKYIIRLTVNITNRAALQQELPAMGISAGSAYPISTNESKDYYTYLIYHADGDLEKESPSYFTEGFFSSAKARMVEGPLESLSYAGVMSQYYATVIMPKEQSGGSSIYATRQEYPLVHEQNAKVPGVTLAMGLPTVSLPPNTTKTLTYDIYTGPKLNANLRDLNATYPDISDIMDYGWLAFLSVPMNWLLNLFHGWLGNWGVAIIGMTIVVRLIIWPLHRKSYIAMKRMSLLQPEMAALKEKYPDNPQKVQMETMKLYQKYGINPAGGCLPILIQMPIFFAFYYVLQSSAELRGEPFCLWITDLSLPDTVAHLAGIPINVLPLIMAATMIIQMLLTPQTGDKTQRMMMMYLMPIIFFVFCYDFASALALYWTIQNLINIVQNFIIRKIVPMPTLEAVKKKKKPGFMQRMMEAQQQALEQQKRQAQQQKQMRNVTPKK